MMFQCRQCDKPFKTEHRTAKFCTQSCYLAHFRDPQTIASRFWDYVNKTETCWLWTGPKRDGGYGDMVVDRPRKERAHRLSWILHNGPIPDGLCVLHRCDVRLCVNPAHLFLGTRTDNAADRTAKLRSVMGERHHQAKLTDDKVRLIRKLHRSGNYFQRQLAEQFSVTQTTISKIVRGIFWYHVKDT